MRIAVLKRRPRVLSGRKARSRNGGMAKLELSENGQDDASAHMRNAGAGWYFDPDDVAVYRYWDGGHWTDDRTDVLPTSSPSS